MQTMEESDLLNDVSRSLASLFTSYQDPFAHNQRVASFCEAF